MSRPHRSASRRQGCITIVAAAALMLPWFARAQDCQSPLEPWTRIELYLGRNMQTGGEVTGADFALFLSEIVTPAFPDGLTVVDALGQYRAGDEIAREKTKLLIILVPDATVAAGPVAAVEAAYKQRFHQGSVLRVSSPVCVAFD